MCAVQADVFSLGASVTDMGCTNYKMEPYSTWATEYSACLASHKMLDGDKQNKKRVRPCALNQATVRISDWALAAGSYMGAHSQVRHAMQAI
jgi:hypothetical protein